MTNKRIRLPKEGLVGPEEVRLIGPDEARFIDETDVEGHGWVNPAPPVDFGGRTPTHGGELEPSDDKDNIEGPQRVR